MSDFLRLVRKEARELLRPRYILPILFIPVVFVGMGAGFGGIDDQVDDEPQVGLVVNDSGQYADLLVETYHEQANVTYQESNVSASVAVDATRESGGKTAVVIPGNFSERIAGGQQPGRVEMYSIVDSVGFGGIINAGQGSGPLGTANDVIAANVTGATPAQLEPVTSTDRTYVKGVRMDRPPSVLSSAITTQFIFIPVAIVMVIIFSGQMVMNSMGIENENKTLETLLTMPVARRTIVAAKLVGSAVVGLFAAGILAGSFWYYQNSLSMGDGGAGLPETFALGPVDYALIGASVFLAVIAALAMALCLGIFAGDQQGAQVLVFPIAVLAGAPAAVTMFADVTTLTLPLRALMYAIPFTYPALAPKELMFGDTLLIVAGVVYQLVFAVAMVGLAVRLFNSDRVVTGDAGRLSDIFSSLQR
jgi:ABC-2 type transport system permease protein